MSASVQAIALAKAMGADVKELTDFFQSIENRLQAAEQEIVQLKQRVSELESPQP